MISSKTKRPVGHPTVYPFSSPEDEKEFFRKAAEAVRLYYHGSEENTKKPFVFPSGLRMGKTAFWAFIYYHMIAEQFFGCENVAYIVENLAIHLGEEHVGDRASINSKILKLKSTGIFTDTPSNDLTPSALKFYNKYHPIYLEVTSLWEQLR